MANITNLSLRALQFLWTLLIMALVGNMISLAVSGNPSIVNYTMFVAVFSMLSLFYLIPASFNESIVGHPMIPLALDALNTLFFVVGAIALAGYLGVHSCHNAEYVSTNLVTSGSWNDQQRCQEAQANDAFLWFGFASYLGSLIISAIGTRSGGANLRGGIGGVRRGPPAMSQV